MDSPVATTANPAGKNNLLELLPAEVRSRVLGRMERLSVKRRDPVFDPDVPMTFVDFPVSAMLSIVAVMADGASVEVGIVGNDGMSGLAVFHGAESDLNEAYYQAPGETLRMPVADFTQEVERHGHFAHLLHLYAHAFQAQVSRTAACNRLHSVQQRFCRWILMSQDRIGSPKLPLTQEFLAIMLGVQRPSVSIVAATVQRAGLIRYHRGCIAVLDKPGLEAAACECYSAVRREFQRLLPDATNRAFTSRSALRTSVIGAAGG